MSRCFFDRIPAYIPTVSVRTQDNVRMYVDDKSTDKEKLL